ncbi:hypothetical protein R3P38DRAFT_2816058 [Favolaschia claudopus]|uniref:RING-type domain-containing protein n=1 Tax=Favolaschia claudopus TaxID=2862362 RepID=A0AAV9Z002_9AGAR
MRGRGRKIAIAMRWGRNPESVSNALCPICREPDDASLVLPCACKHNLYHIDCLIGWNNQCKKDLNKDGQLDCPFCRAVVKPLHIKWVLPDKPMLERQKQRRVQKRADQRKKDDVKRAKEYKRQAKKMLARAGRKMNGFA